ncbi:MAG: ABC transporter substrate-binding protein, partial [Tissierellia bacterium]|nr:ABC transporter substrate-binding protein [Tissierellia bacterium]
MNNFKKILILVLLLSLSISLAACGKTPDDGKTDTKEPENVETPAEKEGETTEASGGKDIVIAVNAEIISLDPHDTSDTLSNTARDIVYEGLMEYTPEMELVPCLAEKYEVSDDGLEYTFYLREGIKFHDGEDFNSEAVKKSFERVKDEANALRRMRDLAYVETVEIIDDYTVKLHLTDPYAPMLSRLAGIKIMSPKLVEAGKDEILKHPVGTGAYVFEKWTPGEGYVAKKNPDYWREGPKVDSITMKAVVENGARIAMLQTGEADFIYPLPTEQVNAIKDDPNINIIEGPSTIARFAFINMTKEQFKDKRVRQAMNYAVDKQAYAQIV